TDIVFDRFHIIREMTKALDTVRKQEHRAFLRVGEDSPLTGTRYRWLFSEGRRPITNGVAEGLDSKIMSIKRKAGGFRNSQKLHDGHLFTAAAWTSTHAEAGRGSIRMNARRSC